MTDETDTKPDAAAGADSPPEEGASTPSSSSDVASPEGKAAPGDGMVGTSPIRVRLEVFEGPLDLLVHLVKKNEYDIFDIPIAEITAQYLAYMDLLQSLNLDVAGDFLVMAATLMKIKSRMLLPPGDEDEEDEGEDPRAALAQQLAEYMRYKQAAEELDEQALLGRDLFARKFQAGELAEAAASEGRLEVSIFELLDAFGKMIEERRIDMPHEVLAERISVAQRINELVDLLKEKESVSFRELFPGDASKIDLIVTFLAILEVVRLSLVRAYQSEAFGDIHLALRAEAQVREDEAAGEADPQDAEAVEGDEPAGEGPDDGSEEE